MYRCTPNIIINLNLFKIYLITKENQLYKKCKQ